MVPSSTTGCDQGWLFKLVRGSKRFASGSVLPSKLMPGTRRHALVYLDGLSATPEEAGVRLAFSLPAGSYATVVLGEVMKVAGLDDSDEA